MLFSTDGVTWTTLSASPTTTSLNGSIPMIDDGAHFYVGGTDGYHVAPLTGGALTLTAMASTPVTTAQGNSAALVSPGYMDQDATHHVIYSSNMDGGFWRYVTQ
jgi:hypothetical protein